MATFVLLHGAWHGGWCWQRVRARLEDQGHEVFTPTFSGLSDRAHVLTRETGLDTHVEDVVRLLDFEDLTDVHLVGHSYAGQVVAAVAALRPDRLAMRIHLDAFLPEDGDRAIDLLPESVAHHYREAVAGPGEGWLIPPRSLEVLGVSDPSDLAWLTPRLTPQPWRTYDQPVVAASPVGGTPGAFVHCVDWLDVFAPFAEKARAAGWEVHDLATGHEAMVTAPDELAEILDALSNSPR